jgi:predicted DNA binding CopG/RHH family protein
MTAPMRKNLFNGSFTKNFKVVDVQIFPSVVVNTDAILILHFDDSLKVAASAKDSAQFGWANIDALAQDWSYVDPDHVIINDLHISAIAAAPMTLNYVIKLERITISMSQSILDEVKNRQQS